MKIQYYLSDLSQKLGIGKIHNIHIAEENGNTVLRIECDESKTSEWKTVTAKSSGGPAIKKPAKKPATKQQALQPAPENRGIIAQFIQKNTGYDIGPGADLGEMMRRG